MGDDRYDWSTGTRARDFDIVVEELGGVYNAKPKIMVEKLTSMGHQVTYNQVKSRLQAERRRFQKEQEYQNTSSSPLESQTEVVETGCSPFEYQPPPQIFHPSMAVPRYPRSDQGGTIFTLSGITDADIGKVSDLLSSMSVEEKSKNNESNNDLKVDAKLSSDFMSDLPSVSIGKFLQESFSDPDKIIQLYQFQQSQQQNLSIQLDDLQMAMDESYSFQKSFDKSLLDDHTQFLSVDNFDVDAYEKQQQQQQQQWNHNQQGKEDCQQYEQPQILFQMTQQQQQQQQQQPQCQQYNAEYNYGTLMTSASPQSFSLQAYQNIEREYPNGVLQEEFKGFGQRTVITGDPSSVQRWQN